TFSKYPKLLKDHHLLHFVCDTLRLSVSGVVAAHDLDASLENDIEVHHHEAMTPVRALSTVADALPGLGIVAAVLGVVITMGALSGPPEQIGEKVGAALVGTFLGILLSYGVVAPLAANIEKIVDAGSQFYQVMRAGLMAFAKGMAPSIAVEFARRAIPQEARPPPRRRPSRNADSDPSDDCHSQSKEAARWAARWGVEGCLRGLRHRDD